jgi:tetratricopeptide (TPR) repeat protein
MLLSLSVMMALFTVFIINKDIAYGIVSGKYFWFYTSIAILSVVAIPAIIIKRKERLSFKLPDLLILLFCMTAVLITLNYTGRLTNKCLLLIFATVFFFYLRIFFTRKSKLIYGLCILAFVITGLAEAVWGLMQLYGFTYSQHGLFKTTGSFFNPGPYSGWLATVFPMALGYVICNYKSKVIGRKSPPVFVQRLAIILCSLTVFCILITLPAAMSRASWLAAFGGSTFVVIMHLFVSSSFSQRKGLLLTVRNYFHKYRKKIIVLSVVAVILLTVSMAGLFLLKKDSASGRIFTWKISLQTIVEHPFGVGLGNFGGSYGDAQAEYFAAGAGSDREEHVAGGVEYAFNEYLQICIETGIIPFLVFLAFAVSVLVIGVRNKNILPAGSLVSLLIFASMSYPFNVLPFVIAFVFLSALCVADNNGEKPQNRKPYPKLVIWAFLITVPVSIAMLFQFSTFNVQYYNAYKQWKNTSALHYANMHSEAIEEYAVQYPYLQDELKFLFEYAQSLSKSEKYEKSNEILRQAMQINCDPMLYNIMGRNCQALKQYELAEQCLKKSINLVPNRLYPHYLLAKLYHETGQKVKMESEINIVMTKPPKVESMAVKEMREELIQLTINNE